MIKHLPFIVVGIVLVPLTVYQWSLMDWVWGNNLPSLQCAYLLHKDIPLEVGDWVGKDKEIDAEILDTAGADGYIDRVYVNQKTGEQVAIWLIVGHFRQVARHTPNVCYKGQGFEEVGASKLYPFEVEGQPDSSFRTSKFMRERDGMRQYQRVFWAWWRPDAPEEGESIKDVRVAWSSPEEPRVGFGYCRALYKLYFTAVTDEEETIADSPCHRFAAEFIPIVDKVIRESGAVLNNEELPPDHLKYLPQLRDGKDEPTNDSPKKDAKPEESAKEEEGNAAA